MSTLRGIAVVTGANGLVFTIAADAGGAGAALLVPQNNTLTRDADMKYLKDGAGDSKAVFITDRKKKIKFEGVPYSTTIALAKLETDKFLLAAGGTVVFTDSDLTVTDAAFGAKYLLESCECVRVNDDFLRVTINAMQSDENDLTLQPT